MSAIAASPPASAASVREALSQGKGVSGMISAEG
jgi:hypothetical protein